MEVKIVWQLFWKVAIAVDIVLFFGFQRLFYSTLVYNELVIYKKI